MIDRDARKRLGRLMRNFAIGRVNNHEFDNIYEAIERDTDDWAIFSVATPTFAYFNEYATVRLTGKDRQTRYWRRTTARWLLFLQTDLEYIEPPLPWQERVRGLMSSLTLGLVPKGAQYKSWEWHERNVWPFLTAEQLQEARQQPRLLCG